MEEHYFKEWGNKYSIKEDGTVTKHTKIGKNKTPKSVVLTPKRNANTKHLNVYIAYKYRANSKTKVLGRMSVSRLLGLAFIPNPDKKTCLAFKDGDPENIELSNLEWRTRLEMRIFSRDTGRMNLKLNAKDAKAIRKSTKSPTFLAEKYGISYNHIGLVRSGRVWKTLKKINNDKKSTIG